MFFKSVDRSRGLGMMAGAGRELAIAERTQDPAQRCLAHRDPELLPDPHRQVFQSPAYDPMHRRHRTALDHRCQSLALGGVQLARMARRLAVREPLGAMRVEPQHPVLPYDQRMAPIPTEIDRCSGVFWKPLRDGGAKITCPVEPTRF